MGKKIYFISNNTIGETGISGGCRIWIELAKRWDAIVMGCPYALIIAKRYGFDGDCLVSSPSIDLPNVFTKWAIFKNTLIKTWYGCCFVVRNKHLFKDCIVYSVSDFLPDFLPALLIKIMNPKIKWIAGYYLFAPPPWNTPYKDFWRGFMYWLYQKLNYPLIKYFSDCVYVTSEPDKKKFRKSVVIRGGVDIPKEIPKVKKIYDAVFVGRFHPQKGVLELIDVWKKVCEWKCDAHLVMVGNGELKTQVAEKIILSGLENNIILHPFLDGSDKDWIFLKSKVFVQPAIYDSGGMAYAEAMAFGLPGVGFNLPCYKNYYPDCVMIKANGINHFAEKVYDLVTSYDSPGFLASYDNMSRDCRYEAKKWDWDVRAKEIWDETFQYI